MHWLAMMSAMHGIPELCTYDLPQKQMPGNSVLALAEHTVRLHYCHGLSLQVVTEDACTAEQMSE